jgi:hypothetical protein
VTRPLACALALLAWAATARAAAPMHWGEVFAAEQDTAVFVTDDGGLVRAPISLVTRETLWAPSGGEHVVRLEVSPDGRQVAWLTRASDSDTTRLWLHDAEGPRQRLRYFAYISGRHGIAHSEPDEPTTEDDDARGGRLVQPGMMSRRRSVNTLAWYPDGRAVFVGYDGGLAAVRVDGGRGVTATAFLPIAIDRVDGFPALLLDAVATQSDTEGAHVSDYDLEHLPVDTNIRVVGGRKVSVTRGRYLLYWRGDHLQVCRGDAIAASRVRAGGGGTLWWADEHAIHAAHQDTCGSIELLRTGAPIVWLGNDAAHRAVVWAAGNQVGRLGAAGGEATLVLRTRAPIRMALPSGTGRTVGLVTSESLLVWRPADDQVEAFGLAGLDPCALFESREGPLVVQVNCGPALGRQLARADAHSHRLVPVATPRVRQGVFRALGSGAWVLLYDPAPKPPATLYAYDVRGDRWVTVENPGIRAWEPFGHAHP